MPNRFVATAVCLLVGLAQPAFAQACRDCGRPGERRPQAVQHRHAPAEAERKPRICHRPDVGRYSRLIPYSC